MHAGKFCCWWWFGGTDLLCSFSLWQHLTLCNVQKCLPKKLQFAIATQDGSGTVEFWYGDSFKDFFFFLQKARDAREIGTAFAQTFMFQVMYVNRALNIDWSLI